MKWTEGQKITGREGPTQNQVIWKPRDGWIPMEQLITGSRMGGIVGLAIGMPWFYFSGEYLLKMVRLTGFSMGQTFLILMVTAGLFVILAGLSQFVYSEKTVIDGSTVFYKRTGLTGQHEWREPLNHYRGILKESRYCQRSGVGQDDYMNYALILDHEERAKRVRLYESQNTIIYPPVEWERLWRKYGELFRLPLLERTPEGEKSSSVEELGEPLLKKIAEGKVDISEMDLNCPNLPSCLSLHREDDLWVITLKPSRQVWNFIALLVMISLLAVQGIIFWNHSQNIFPILMTWSLTLVLLVSSVFSMNSLRHRLRHPDQIALDAEKLWYRKWNRHEDKWDTSDMPLAGLLDIQLVDVPSMRYRGERLVVESEHTKLECGQYLTGRGRRALRNLLLYLISNLKVRQ